MHCGVCPGFYRYGNASKMPESPMAASTCKNSDDQNIEQRLFYRVRDTLDIALGVKFMKRNFGNPLSRIFRGGVVLSEFESWSVGQLVAELPPALRETVEAQFNAYSLAQREVDGRALNFYPRRSEMQGRFSVPTLPMEAEEAPLMRMKLATKNPPSALNAVLHAVNGRAFCVSFSKDTRPLARASGFEVKKVVHAWRSNFRLADAQQAVPSDRADERRIG